VTDFENLNTNGKTQAKFKLKEQSI